MVDKIVNGTKPYDFFKEIANDSNVQESIRLFKIRTHGIVPRRFLKVPVAVVNITEKVSRVIVNNTLPLLPVINSTNTTRVQYLLSILKLPITTILVVTGAAITGAAIVYIRYHRGYPPNGPGAVGTALNSGGDYTQVRYTSNIVMAPRPKYVNARTMVLYNEKYTNYVFRDLQNTMPEFLDYVVEKREGVELEFVGVTIENGQIIETWEVPRLGEEKPLVLRDIAHNDTQKPAEEKPLVLRDIAHTSTQKPAEEKPLVLRDIAHTSTQKPAEEKPLVLRDIAHTSTQKG
jgi:hypothetical protein